MTTATLANQARDRAGSPGTARRRGATRNAPEARRKLLDAAFQLFGRQGFMATSAEQIADRAGYSQATIFFHFDTKTGLLKACLEEALARAMQSIPAAEHRGTIDVVRALDAVFDDDPTAEFFARLMIEQSRGDMVQPIYAAFHAHVRGLIGAELHDDTDADPGRCAQVAGAILSMMVGVHAEYRVENQRFDRADYRAMLVNVATLLVDDLRSDARDKSRCDNYEASHDRLPHGGGQGREQ